jgi:REP element-mobilizing transposase RayT
VLAHAFDMPRPRKHLLSPFSGSAHYHCVSRVVDRNFVFGAHERDVFRKILRQVERFSGVRVITWTMLSNHFHVLLRVPPRPAEPPEDSEILARCRALYTPKSMLAVDAEFKEALLAGEAARGRVREKYLKRMWDLSEFMKTLKQRFTSWFNRLHGRIGTLWESRFRSVLVEGSYRCLLKVGAYIDLNAVRAGIVSDPVDYRWCGYAEAASGDRVARRGLAEALGDVEPGATWRKVGQRYRHVLFGIREAHETTVKHSTSDELAPASVARALSSGVRLTLAQLLRCRVRYFTAGLAVGTDSFVEAFFRSRRESFSATRRSGARRLKGGDWGELRCARDLSVHPLSAACTGSQ